ncbi:MAG: thioredoxin-disulfide reductase [Clostridia bacterium]|nr:thioredoxin-disulfide reductase [Clostridia bacterium]
MEKIYDMIVVGGGPGGYTAALYGARAGLDVLVIERMSVGGQMALTGDIDNYPGFDEGIDGFTLGMRIQAGAERFGAKTEYASVTELIPGMPITVRTDAGDYFCRTLVFATGAYPRKLGIPEEESLVGQGIHYCAHCDGRFYKGKTVAVVGGGNSAAEDALYLSHLASKVYLIHRREELRADKIYKTALEGAKNVEILYNTTVASLVYDERVRSLCLDSTVGGGKSEIEIDALFVSVGRVPESALLDGIAELDPSGYVVADETTRTSVEGIFAVGDVRTKALRQVITAAADGATAAYYAEKYISTGEEAAGVGHIDK